MLIMQITQGMPKKFIHLNDQRNMYIGISRSMSSPTATVIINGCTYFDDYGIDFITCFCTKGEPELCPMYIHTYIHTYVNMHKLEDGCFVMIT
jgi:hypothetical protein